MNLSFEIEIGKAHAAVLSLLLILATASATVDVKDTLVMHGTLDLNANKIVDLAGPDNPSDAATKQYVDNNAGDGAPALNWSKSITRTSGMGGSASIDCQTGKVLRDATCFSDARPGGSDAEGHYVEGCDARTEYSAYENDGQLVGVSGTCVPIKGAELQVFSNQNSSNTFEVPSDASKVEYEIHGGMGGGNDGRGGYVKGSMPVNGGETLEVYVGQDGANGEPGGGSGGTGGDGGRGGCVPFNGVTCGGDGGDGGITGMIGVPDIGRSGGSGGGAPSLITDSSGIVAVAGGGAGSRGGYGGGGGGGGAGGGSGAEDGDQTPKNLGGDANNGDGGTFVRNGLPVRSTGTTSESPKVELAAIP